MRRTASGRSLGTAEAEDARGAGPVRVGRCERSESQRAHVVSRRFIVEEVVRFVRARPRSRVSVARSRCAQGKRRPSVARVGGVTVGRVERHLGRVALKRSCPLAHGRARRRTSRFEHARPPTKRGGRGKKVSQRYRLTTSWNAMRAYTRWGLAYAQKRPQSAYGRINSNFSRSARDPIGRVTLAPTACPSEASSQGDRGVKSRGAERGAGTPRAIRGGRGGGAETRRRPSTLALALGEGEVPADRRAAA